MSLKPILAPLLLCALLSCSRDHGMNNTSSKPLVLGVTLPFETVLAPRDAQLCPSNAHVTMSVANKLAMDDQGVVLADVTIGNASEQDAKTCLMPFSVLGSPLVYLEIENMKGEYLLDAPPEVYPVADEQVGFQVFTIPAHASVLLRQSFFQQPNIAKGEKVRLKWQATLNQKVQSGSESIDWPL